MSLSQLLSGWGGGRLADVQQPMGSQLGLRGGGSTSPLARARAGRSAAIGPGLAWAGLIGLIGLFGLYGLMGLDWGCTRLSQLVSLCLLLRAGGLVIIYWSRNNETG